MDPIVISMICSILAYTAGHAHAKIGNSSCLWGCCSMSDLDTDINLLKDKTDMII